ncbi:uncharacterized protein FIBRA_00837 [Fibroporia radiculosa]|uniref:NAD(P)-binding protein n=1 Tax=Fibroporia radiculosa TaxID=599839 RepID=J4HSA0_9APHY|nr:uncharacterized protein FIBRA_00837 [Fibroporia radiculosa]CCL98832.1 predicted protein [Fibroporia radiculosa]
MPSYAVVGGSRGIGLELVRQLAANPDNVVFVTARNKAKSTYLSALIAESSNRNVHVVEADVVDARAMKTAAAEIAKMSGGALDVLIHNAARMEYANLFKAFDDYETDDQLDAEFIESFKVNALGVVHSVNAFLPLLRENTTKKIVIIGSGAGERSLMWNVRMHTMVAYGTSKAATNMVATKYAAQLESEGFTVVSLSPGIVDVSGTAVSEFDDASKAELARQLESFRKAMPDVDLTPITPEESVKTLLKIIGSLSVADTGSFISSFDPRFAQTST